MNLLNTKLVVPAALQMGWCESPPFFCMASETAKDAIQELMERPERLPQHKFEHKMMPNNLQETCPQVPVLLLEVFVDDFIGATNEATEDSLRHLSRCMLHGVHSIFPPAKVADHGGGDSIAEKKLDKGKGRWDTTKEILGWIVDGRAFTIQLPDDKIQKILTQLKNIIKIQAQNITEADVQNCREP